MVGIVNDFKKLQSEGYYIEEKEDIMTIRSPYGRTTVEIVKIDEERKVILTPEDMYVVSGTIEIGAYRYLGLGPKIEGKQDAVYGTVICIVAYNYRCSNEMRLCIMDNIFSTKYEFYNYI